MKEIKEKKIKQLTIDENNWGTGYLANEGEYCALGFLCKRLGYSDKEMDEITIPSDLERSPPSWFDKDLSDDNVEDMLEGIEDAEHYTDFDDVVPAINDAEELDQEEKKFRLKKVFKMVGIDLHFKS